MSARTLVLVVVLLGCAGDGTGLDEHGMPLENGPPDLEPGPSVTLSGDVQPILSVNCALSGCHAGLAPVLELDLSGGRTFGSVVDVPSVQVPALRRVQPLLPDSSYLVHKIQGTQVSVGGSGSRMPLAGGPLRDDEIAVIRAWVSAGALNN